MAEGIGVDGIAREIVHRGYLINLLVGGSDSVIRAGLIGPVTEPFVVRQRPRGVVRARWSGSVFVGIESAKVFADFLSGGRGRYRSLSQASMPCQVHVIRGETRQRVGQPFRPIVMRGSSLSVSPIQGRKNATSSDDAFRVGVADLVFRGTEKLRRLEIRSVARIIDQR